MYTSFFGLKENPFNVTPDPKFFYLSLQHREALNHLIYGINEKKGFIVITGGIGTGKTTICRAILSMLSDSISTALIFNSYISDLDLLETIIQEFGIMIEPGEQSKKRYIDALNSFLLENFTAGKNAVLLIDESQNLPLTTLEQIRMLSNLETEKEKLLQIVLLGQPELDDLLHAPLLKQLNERITVRYDIEPLDRSQVSNYVEHRLVVAGGTNNTPRFLTGAYNALYVFSKGIPRRINTICDRALLIAYTKDNREIDAGIIEQAAHDVGGRHILSHRHGFTSPWWNALLYVFFFVIILALLGIINSDNIAYIVSSWKSAP
ncbi:MAG TPA: AAA family ATPase [Deltaproteobacteria bacterium]|nr:AAA family ATPase [Deltaproteobacteria bacterium]